MECREEEHACWERVRHQMHEHEYRREREGYPHDRDDYRR